jgi:hypothetical protein
MTLKRCTDALAGGLAAALLLSWAVSALLYL